MSIDSIVMRQKSHIFFCEIWKTYSIYLLYLNYNYMVEFHIDKKITQHSQQVKRKENVLY